MRRRHKPEHKLAVAAVDEFTVCDGHATPHAHEQATIAIAPREHTGRPGAESGVGARVSELICESELNDDESAALMWGRERSADNTRGRRARVGGPHPHAR